MAEVTEGPSLGARLEYLREQRGFSVRQAAERAGISPTWWTNMVADPDRAKARVLASMAFAVRLDPEELVEYGREDAAQVLYDRASRWAGGNDATRDTIEDDPRLTDEGKAVMLDVLEGLLRRSPQAENGPPSKRRQA